MDVKGVYNSTVIPGTVTVSGKGAYGSASFIDRLEKMCEDMGVESKVNFDELRKLMEELDKIRASNKKAAEELEDQIKELKKKIAENMIKTIRMLSSKNYTKQSWKNSMAEVAEAVKIMGAGDVTASELETCLKHLRAAMSKLEPARKDDERGREYHRKKALQDEAEQAMALKAAEYTNTSGSTVDITIEADAVSAESKTAVSETV